jgi:hypothetical protein
MDVVLIITEVVDWVFLGMLSGCYVLSCIGFAIAGYLKQRTARRQSRAIAVLGV